MILEQELKRVLKTLPGPLWLNAKGKGAEKGKVGKCQKSGTIAPGCGKGTP